MMLNKPQKFYEEQEPEKGLYKQAELIFQAEATE